MNTLLDKTKKQLHIWIICKTHIEAHASGVLFACRILIKLKENFHKIAIRLAMLHGSECWAVKKQPIH